MGGQACVLYGAAEFSRDLDLALFAEPGNLERLKAALAELEAISIAVPPFERRHLEAGLAVHFRCQHPEANGLRIDVMTRMRGVAPFQELWSRRTTFEIADEVLEVLSLPDLVASKKTQRDKDWPMVRRLVEVNYLGHLLVVHLKGSLIHPDIRTGRTLLPVDQVHQNLTLLQGQLYFGDTPAIRYPGSSRSGLCLASRQPIRRAATMLSTHTRWGRPPSDPVEPTRMQDHDSRTSRLGD